MTNTGKAHAQAHFSVWCKYYDGTITEHRCRTFDDAKQSMLGRLIEMIADPNLIRTAYLVVHAGHINQSSASFRFSVDNPGYRDKMDHTLVTKATVYADNYLQGVSEEVLYTEVLAAFGANIQPRLIVSYDVEGRLFK